MTEPAPADRIIGRPDKPFHKAECQCQACRDWCEANPIDPAPAEPAAGCELDVGKWLSEWLWKFDRTEIYDGPIIPEVKRLMRVMLESFTAGHWHAASGQGERDIRDHKYLNAECGLSGCQWLVAEHQADVYRQQMAKDAATIARQQRELESARALISQWREKVSPLNQVACCADELEAALQERSP